MLEEREDGFSREAVVFSVQKRSDSSAYKQLRRSKPKSGEHQAFAVTGGVRITPDAMDLVTAVESQADHRAAVEMAARAAEVIRVGELATAAVAPRPQSPGGGACWVCKNNHHYVRACPKQIYQGCGERGY